MENSRSAPPQDTVLKGQLQHLHLAAAAVRHQQPNCSTRTSSSTCVYVYVCVGGGEGDAGGREGDAQQHYLDLSCSLRWPTSNHASSLPRSTPLLIPPLLNLHAVSLHPFLISPLSTLLFYTPVLPPPPTPPPAGAFPPSSGMQAT